MPKEDNMLEELKKIRELLTPAHLQKKDYGMNSKVS